MRSTGSMLLDTQLCDRDHESAFQVRPVRTRTCLIGKMVLGDGTFTVDCAIRDISEGGAKIILSRQQLLPPEFYLIIVKYCVAYQAKIAWRNFPARGLKFSNKYPLSETVPEELKFLRQLWVNLFAGFEERPATSQWELGELAARCDSTH